MSQITNEQEKLIDEFKSGNKDVFPLIIDNIKIKKYFFFFTLSITSFTNISNT